MKRTSPARVVIVGGGLAGLATAAALADTPLEIQLYEARRQTGGRAGSFAEASGGQAVDYCQHVAMGCCTNVRHLLRWAGLEAEFTRYDRLTFLAAGVPPSSFAPSAWLPPPLHFAPAFSRLHYLTPGERREIGRGLWRLMRRKQQAAANARGEETIGQWLRQNGQSEATIDKFWNVVLSSALGDHVGRVAIGPARQVFVDGFLGARGAAEVFVPRQPLSELFGRRLPARLAAAGVKITSGARVRGCELASGRFTIHSDAAPATDADDLVLATPWHALPRLLEGSSLAAAIPGLAAIGRFPGAAISGIHLWLDRPLTRLPHAVVIGRMSQWVFRDPCGVGPASAEGRRQAAPGDFESASGFPGGGGHYYQVVVSGADGLRGRPRDTIAAEAVADLRAVFPEAGPIRCLHSRVVTDPAAVFSIGPEVEAARPATETAQPGLYLAGDWVQTGWPATMESAVLSGYRAAAAIRRRHGLPAAVEQPPLAASLLARCLVAR